MSTILLTEAAQNKVDYFLKEKGRNDLYLRIGVQPGGCSGLRYKLAFDNREIEGDVIKMFGDVKVVMDKMSAPYLDGVTIVLVEIHLTKDKYAFSRYKFATYANY